MNRMQIEITEQLEPIVECSNHFPVENSNEIESSNVFSGNSDIALPVAVTWLALFFDGLEIKRHFSLLRIYFFDKVRSFIHLLFIFYLSQLIFNHLYRNKYTIKQVKN